ncbi:hypothetical protein IJT10_09150 [bacterium]|nr:hypothetical protein [bacterium]
MDKVFEVPILPVSTFVCQPGTSIDFRLPNRGYYQQLLEHIDGEKQTRLAIAYLRDEDENEYAPVSEIVTLINIDTCRAIKKRGNILAWQLHSENGQRAHIEEEKKIQELRYAKVSLKREEFWHKDMESSTYFILIPLWTELKSLGVNYDSRDSALPSLGNRYFYGYTFAPERFLTSLYTSLPLTYQQKLKYLEANDLQAKSMVMLSVISALKKENFRQKFTPLTLSQLVKVSPYALARNN